ncbi:glycoside hydrolase family 127 protein [Pelomonas sp. KK5]|uniref:glycoside hydrolase family 127 protein n=1 Tax=Pelomonas sp. KK5 TaxID=1855730 RepID=UPI00097C7974|nr:beta-L-arabinofuranosidase domain-containing protein [Pelomonas sp. KK5]
MNQDKLPQVVDVSASRGARVQPVSPMAVSLAGRFWAPRLQRNREVSLPTQHALLESTGRLDNFRRVAGTSDAPYTGLFFNDSDIYKWLEAAAWAQVSGPVPELQALIDQTIPVVEAAQQPDGYLNTYHSLERADTRWSNLRDLHELYCAGHLMQAAVALNRVCGDARLLKVACRFADLIDEVFGPAEAGKLFMIDGHEEVEMGLIELARETGEDRYRRLARFFIEARGRGLLHGGRFGIDYFQDEQPFMAMTSLAGHAVRAVYMACGIADLALDEGDAAALAQLERLWTEMTRRRMYLSGGIGSRHEGEAFGKDFELPNARAYTETCAAIGSMMWCHRMLAATGDARYADLLEWTLYNGMLPGWGQDGRRYFYVNPLEDDGTHVRQSWYECSCCPPNVARTLGALPGYAYGSSEGALWVHLYIEGRATLPLGGGSVELIQRTDYPWDGAIAIEVGTPGRFALKLRVPGWCRGGVALSVNGEVVEVSAEPGSYLSLERDWQAGDIVRLALPMAVTPWQSHPQLHENRGRIALSRGPLLYCLEAQDQPRPLQELAIDPAGIEAVFEAATLGGVVVLRGQASARAPAPGWEQALYLPAEPDPGAGERVAFTAVPYFAWQNRGAAPMSVWMPRAHAMTP